MGSRRAASKGVIPLSVIGVAAISIGTLVWVGASATKAEDPEDIVVTGVVVHGSEEQPLPAITTLSELPARRDDVIEGVEVVFSNSRGERSVAMTGPDGDFKVSLSHLGGKAEDSLAFRHASHQGLGLHDLVVDEGALHLKRGENIVLVELPGTSCPVRRPSADADEPAG